MSWYWEFWIFKCFQEVRYLKMIERVFLFRTFGNVLNLKNLIKYLYCLILRSYWISWEWFIKVCYTLMKCVSIFCFLWFHLLSFFIISDFRFTIIQTYDSRNHTLSKNLLYLCYILVEYTYLTFKNQIEAMNIVT